MSAIGVLLLLCVVPALGAGAWVVWRRPALALPIFVAGLAVHNLVLMILVGSGAPDLIVRAIQAWKEAYVVVLGLRLCLEILRAGGLRFVRRSIGVWAKLPLLLRLIDLAALGFALILVLYLLLPSSLLPSPSPSLAQRFVSFRTLMLIPGLYLFGRVWPLVDSRDRRTVVVGVVATAALVSIAGLVELWFVPTHVWADWGIVQFNRFQGFTYRGPGGLPENFFQSTTSGLGLRRMVSTYLSPLGIAYTGLLAVPLAVGAAVASRRHSTSLWIAFTLIIVGIALSVTRLALGCLVGEAILLAVIFRRRVVAAASTFAVLAAIAALVMYPNFGPMVRFDLEVARPALGAAVLGFDKLPPGTPSPSTSPGASPRPSASTSSETANVSRDIVNRLVSGDDSSIQAHLVAVRGGAEFVLKHPLGFGLGASVPRLGAASGPGESALFQIGGEVGLAGFALFLAMYGGVIAAGTYLVWARRSVPGTATVPLVLVVGGLGLAPIVLTSQVWGNLSVTFIFWWLAGASLASWSRVTRDSQIESRRTTEDVASADV